MWIFLAFYVGIGAFLGIVVGVIFVIIRFYCGSNPAGSTCLHLSFFSSILCCSCICRIIGKICCDLPFFCFLCCFFPGCLQSLFFLKTLSGSSSGRIDLVCPSRIIIKFCQISGKILFSKFGGQWYTFNPKIQIIPVFYQLERLHQSCISHRTLICGSMHQITADLISSVIHYIFFCFAVKSRCCRLKKLDMAVYC